MSDSSLVCFTQISPNSNNPRNKPITKITLHHMAGNMTLPQFGALVAQPARQMSANYAIDSQGNIGLFCREANRSWCSSSSANDHEAITAEIANDGGAPDWHVSDKALAAAIDLCVDVCRRNGIAKLIYTGNASGNLTEHNYFTATACPGPYLKSKLPYIAAEVNKRLSQPVEVEKMLMSTKPVAMKIGPMSGGDMSAMKTLLNSPSVTYTEKNGYLETVAVSPGDQDPILQKCTALQLGFEPLGAAGSVYDNPEYKAAIEELNATREALTAADGLITEANAKAADAEKREQAALQRADVADKEAARFRAVAYPLKESLAALMDLK